MKRIISLIIIVSMVFAVVPSTPTVTVASASHEFDVFDALNILKYIVGMEPLTPEQRILYNFFGNDKIDIFNALEILKYIVGMVEYPGGLAVVRLVVNPNQLRQMGWVEASLTPAIVADLNRTLRQFNITTPPRIRHFISQCAHESGMGRWTTELAGGAAYENCYLAVVSAPCTPTLRCAGKRLGNTQLGDGPRFKGAGYLQITGRWNYQQFANFVGDQRVMEGHTYVAANYPWLSAGFWWHNAGMNAFIDGGATVEQVTRRVNGGINGLADRIRLYEIAVGIFR
jgi:predicted chitinase